jgi:pimeloyl-ACP methyl ester carboxylesterase
MHVLVNGVRLFFDVEGAGLVPDGPVMREKPTLLLLHGGPGFDHSIYKPAYSALADIAQVIYLDHRGNGRSEDGPRESWNLAQWGDDVRAFCEVLGIVSPIVLGASFGGMVALAYATRHPAHPSKLVLISTEAAGGTHRSGAWRCSNVSAARKSARWRAAGSWRCRATPTRLPSMPGNDWPFRSTRVPREIPTSRAARSTAPRCDNGS